MVDDRTIQVLVADVLGARHYWYWGATHPNELPWLEWFHCCACCNALGLKPPAKEKRG